MARTADRPLVKLPVTWLEVFAEAPLGGNLHAVVHDADCLDDSTMAAFSTRMRLSETSFVQAPVGDEGADYRHRIFTVAGELPFAGHPSLGTATAVARARREHSARLVQQTGAGLQALTVELDPAGAVATTEIVQNPPEHLARPDPATALAALGLTPADAHPDLGAAVVSTGLPTFILPVRDAGVLARIRADVPTLTIALAASGCPVVTCYVVTPGDRRWLARCFTEQVAGGEDSATGSAAGPLTAYAHRYLGSEAIEIDQGVELGSPSRLWGRLEADRIVVGGHVRVIGDGTIELPAKAV